MNNLEIEDFLKSGFDLKEHLAHYLNLNQQKLEDKLSKGQENMSKLHPGLSLIHI